MVVLVWRVARPVAGRGEHLDNQQRSGPFVFHQDRADEALVGAVAAGLDLDSGAGEDARLGAPQGRRPAQRDLGAVVGRAQPDVRLRRQVGGVGQAGPRIGSAAEVEPLAVLGSDVHDAGDHDHAQLAEAAHALGGTAAFERQHLEADVLEPDRLGGDRQDRAVRPGGGGARRSGAQSSAERRY